MKPGTIVANKFEILRPLGSGGMGVVMAARNLQTGGEVALKWIHPAASSVHTERLQREAQAAARVRHANVVTVFDVVEDNERIILVMELLLGENLEQCLQRQAPALDQLLFLLRDAMHGVAAAHESGVIHRDVKPANIFLLHKTQTSRPTVKVLDFGVSKVAAPDSGPITQTGALLGTLCYMSPEQLSGSRDVDPRTDVYSFGVILYEAVTGRLPFIGTPAEVISRSLTTYPPLPSALRPDIPAELDALIVRAMHPDLAARFCTMEELIGAVDALLESPEVRERSSMLVAQPPMLSVMASRQKEHASHAAAAPAQHRRPLCQSTEAVSVSPLSQRRRRQSQRPGALALSIAGALLAFAVLYLLRTLLEPKPANHSPQSPSYRSDMVETSHCAVRDGSPSPISPPATAVVDAKSELAPSTAPRMAHGQQQPPAPTRATDSPAPYGQAGKAPLASSNPAKPVATKPSGTGSSSLENATGTTERGGRTAHEEDYFGF